MQQIIYSNAQFQIVAFFYFLTSRWCTSSVRWYISRVTCHNFISCSFKSCSHTWNMQNKQGKVTIFFLLYNQRLIQFRLKKKLGKSREGKKRKNMKTRRKQTFLKATFCCLLNIILFNLNPGQEELKFILTHMISNLSILSNCFHPNSSRSRTWMKLSMIFCLCSASFQLIFV